MNPTQQTHSIHPTLLHNQLYNISEELHDLLYNARQYPELIADKSDLIQHTSDILTEKLDALIYDIAMLPL